MGEKDSLYYLFSKPVQARLAEARISLMQFQEIRLRVAQGIAFCVRGKKYWLKNRGGISNDRNDCYVLSREDMGIFLNSCSGHSIYAFAGEMKQGYLTIQGGHRVGFAGTLISENGRIQGFSHVGSVNLRIAHEIKGCAEDLLCRVFENGRFCSTLIVSPPGGGKTTLLRDMIRLLSDGSGYALPMHIAVSDERGEIGACCDGFPSFDLGCNTDVMDGGNKAENIWMMLRSLGPQVIAMDEIGGQEEAAGLLTAGHWGIGLLASMHGTVGTAPWRQTGLEFERYIEPEMTECGWIYKVYDRDGRNVCENCRNFSDCSRNPAGRKRMGKAETRLRA